MAINKPETGDQNTGVKTAESASPIEPVKLKTVNGLRGQIKKILMHAAILFTAGTVGGGVAGSAAQDAFRGYTGYDPRGSITEPSETEQGQYEEKESHPEEADAKGFMEKAKKTLGKAKNWAAKEVKDMAGNSKLAQEYRNVRREMEDMYRKTMELGDKTAFWLPFLLMFLATVLLANKIIRVKKALTQSVDPAVERNMKVLEGKLNEVITRANGMGPKLTPEMTAEIQGMVGEFHKGVDNPKELV